MFKLFGKARKESPSAEITAKLAEARALVQRGQLPEAAAVCRQILEHRGEHIDSLMLCAEIAAGQRDFQDADELYSKITLLQPDYVAGHYKRANLLQDCGQLEAAVASYDRAIALDSGHAFAYCNRGSVLERLGNLDAALASLDRAVALSPADPLAHTNRGTLLRRLGRSADALAAYERAIAVKPDFLEAHFNRSGLLAELHRREEALASYGKTIEIAPGLPRAYLFRGALLRETGRADAALADYDKAIELDPGFSEAWKYRGVLLNERGRPDAALASYARAIEADPSNAEAYYNRGVILQERRHSDAAMADYDKAIALVPHFVEAHSNRGGLLFVQGRSADALAAYERALELDPHYLDALTSRGTVLFKTARYVEAIANYDRLLELTPDDLSAKVQRTYAKSMLADWGSLETDIEHIRADAFAERPLTATPFPVLALVDELTLHRQVARIFVRQELKRRRESQEPAVPAAPAATSRQASNKLRIGYFSADFRDHPVSFLSAGLIDHHDRAAFEVTGFAFGPKSGDAMTARLATAFDRFVDVRQKSDLEVVELARELGIDIAVDMTGLTADCRPNVFALRAAPVQVNFLGYPGTLGADFIDYLIADGTVVPRAQQSLYAEKIAYLPGSFLPFDSKYAVSDRVFTREELALPPNGFVFCCFNNTYKIMPAVFERWMRILAATENSVLWLQRTNAIAAENLRGQAAHHGIDGGRLIFAGRIEALPEHVSRLRCADLFLDTLPYNAHATALDALRAGVPLLTCPGDSFASRVAASLLKTAGLPELIAGSAEAYENAAIEFAHQPARLASLRGRLALQSSPLFDTVQYTRKLESAYRTMHERHRAGLAPDHIDEHLAE